nr:Fibronectin type III domain protein [uncultured bacterium]
MAITFVPETSATTPRHATTHTDTVPIANITPSISRLDGQVHFNVEPQAAIQIQKVEFYVENKFVGTAFARPYSVSMSENDLTAGTHTVTAKIYTATAQAKTTPALFTANPTNPPPLDSEEAIISPSSSSTAKASQPVPTVLASPTGLVIVAESSGTIARLTWDTTSSATSYQVWRDGTQIGTTNDTTYTDNGLSPGQTYDYKLIAANGSTDQSAASAQVAITMPVPLPPNSKPSSDSATTDNPDQSPLDSAAALPSVEEQ